MLMLMLLGKDQSQGCGGTHCEAGGWILHWKYPVSRVGWWQGLVSLEKQVLSWVCGQECFPTMVLGKTSPSLPNTTWAGQVRRTWMTVSLKWLSHGEAVTDTSTWCPHRGWTRLQHSLAACWMHQSLGMEGHCRTDGSKSHIWAHWKEVATKHYSAVNVPFESSLDSQESAPEMDSQHGNTYRLGQTTRFGLQLFNISMWQELHMWLKHARWPKTHTTLNTPTPLLPCKATEHEACSKHGTESPWMWVSDSKIEYSEFSSPVCGANWFVLLSDTHFPGSFK